VSVLSELPLLGYCADGPHKGKDEKPLGSCWTFPEHDGSGCVIGLTCRYQDGSKKAWPGGERGLALPAGWRDGGGPILLPEGPSDVLTLTALGRSAVGRTSNMGGVEQLAELLQGLPPDTPIIVLGELDPNDKGLWPGRDGAIKSVGELDEMLARPVQYAFPPDRAKDVRAWVLLSVAYSPRSCVACVGNPHAEHRHRMAGFWIGSCFLTPLKCRPRVNSGERYLQRPWMPGGRPSSAYWRCR
jgi:hypothetical protein